MVGVYARHNEDIDSLLKRFKRVVEKDGILIDAIKKEYFYSASYIKHEKYMKLKYKKKHNIRLTGEDSNDRYLPNKKQY